MLPVQVQRIDDLGRTRLARVTLGPHALVATVPPGVAVRGAEAGVRLDPRRTHVYVNDRLVEAIGA
jgi:glycerol transport system ATP-binding protein